MDFKIIILLFLLRETHLNSLEEYNKNLFTVYGLINSNITLSCSNYCIEGTRIVWISKKLYDYDDVIFDGIELSIKEGFDVTEKYDLIFVNITHKCFNKIISCNCLNQNKKFSYIIKETSEYF